jgi:hypothetical protein
MYKTSYKKWTSAKSAEYNGRRYDSKFEAGVAMDLDLRLRAGEIKDWEPQFKAEMWAYDANGKKAMKKTHKIDFRIHNHDGSFTLLEAKGWESPDYKERRKWLQTFWLPINLDHDYQVVYQSRRKRSFT